VRLLYGWAGANRAAGGRIGALADDRLLRAVPSLRLTLAVWWEDHQPTSFWRHYLGRHRACIWT
jgi:hypothetical protein